MAVTATEHKSYSYKCDVHGDIRGENCPYCDKCEHGVNRCGQCYKCSADSSWATAPITDAELKLVERHVNGLHRYPDKPRNFYVQPLLPKILAEYRALRATAPTPRIES
jgi:hypothetical protein